MSSSAAELREMARTEPEAFFAVADRADNEFGEWLMDILSEEQGDGFIDLRRQHGPYYYGLPEPERGVLNPGWNGEFVYLIEGTHGTVKIGVSTRPRERLKTLSTANSQDLTLLIAVGLPNAFEVERELHASYAQYKHRGEWFKLGSGIIDVVDRLRGLVAEPPKGGKSNEA